MSGNYALDYLAKAGQKLNLRSQQQPQEIIHWGFLMLMKNFINLRMFAFAAIFGMAFSCSSDDGSVRVQEEMSRAKQVSNEQIEPESETVKDNDGQTSRLCRDGYHFEVFAEFKLNLFKGMRTCTSGFGGCFGTSIKLTFDCVRNTAVTANQNAQFYPATNSADFYFRQIDSENLKIYLPATVVRSTDNVPSDFDYFDTGAAQLDGITLVPGRYPNVREGNFFTYTVKFTRR